MSDISLPEDLKFQDLKFIEQKYNAQATLALTGYIGKLC